MTDKQTEAMKLALEALEQIAAYRPLTFAECSDAEAVMGIAENAIPALREALAERPAQQGPVAWGIIASNTGRICQVELDADEVEGHNPKHIVPLYTSPPAQRKPLDAGEISRLWKQHTSEDGPHHNPYDDDGLGFARAIEAKLKEKNNG